VADSKDLMIAENKVVSFHYTLTNDEGDVLDQSDKEPLEYLHGAGNIVPGLEKALDGRKVGEKLQVEVAPEEGYGERLDGGVHKVEKDLFPDDAELYPGAMFMSEDEDGDQTPFWVMDLEEGEIIIDFNHPLAGETLHFDVTISAIRDATEEETEHGHSHC